MNPSKPLIRLSQPELAIANQALESFSVSEPGQVQRVERTRTVFRQATSDLSFDVSLDDLEAVSRALSSHMRLVDSAQRKEVEELGIKLGGHLLIPLESDTRVNRQATDVLINRHAIYLPNMDVCAYELLARRKSLDGSNTGYLVIVRTILDKFTPEGLKQLVGNRPAFISVPWGAVVRGHCGSLSKERTVLEVLDGVDPDASLFQELSKLSRDGYQIVISDALIRKSDHPLVSVANIVKLDLADLGRTAIEARLESFKDIPVRFMAENVATHGDFDFAQDMGFDFFQGYFFCTPQVTGREVPPNRLATTRLLVRLRDPDVDVRALEEVISQDLALAHKLLLFANSAAVGLNRKVESIRHAANLVGLERMRIWATLLMLSKMDDKPRELMMTAVIRAKMCESFGEASGPDRKATYFTVGLFSVLDAVLDCSMSRALELLPLSDEICEALLYRQGALGHALKCVVAYERGDWETTAPGNISDAQIRDRYLDSVVWTEAHAQGLSI